MEAYKIRIHGALALLLYVSRVLCVAPLVFEPCVVRVSYIFSIIGRVYVILKSVIVFIDTYMDVVFFYPERTMISRVFWILIVGGSMVTCMIASYTGSSRMHIYLQSLHCLNQINEEMNNANLEKSEKKIDFSMRCLLVACMIVNTSAYLYYVIVGLNDVHGIFVYKHVIQRILQCSERLVLIVVTMQFAMLALQVLFTLKNINSQFKQAIERFSNRTNELEASSIRRFSFPYISVCGIVRQIVEKDENIISVILFTFLVCLVWIVQTFCSEMNKYSLNDFFRNCIHITITLSTYLIYLVLMIEPCHRVHEEMERTHRLVCKLKQCPNLSTEVTNELEAFELLLAVNKPTYSPLGMFTLARLLFLKIVGALMTYGIFTVQLSDDFF